MILKKSMPCGVKSKIIEESAVAALRTAEGALRRAQIERDLRSAGW
jgi:hypothetical protein